MLGLKVGHFSDLVRGTGVSVFLFEASAAGAYWMCGSAPATLELAVLDPESSVQRCHGLVLTGGSAYGLQAAAGAMRYLGERHIGQSVPTGVIPVVPAAAIYDLAYREACFPSAENAYQACLLATEENTERGQVGAGSGATVGKLVPGAQCMSGGLGRAVLRQSDGLEVVAYVVVNSVGDVHQAGRILAGACDPCGGFINSEAYLLEGKAEVEMFAHSNTTLAVIFTNAALDKSASKRIAKMASTGLARAINPVSTRFDGDIVFCFSLGERCASELTVGAMAAEALRLAVVDAVKDSVRVGDPSSLGQDVRPVFNGVYAVK